MAAVEVVISVSFAYAAETAAPRTYAYIVVTVGVLRYNPE
jgi:hypothetical protein